MTQEFVPQGRPPQESGRPASGWTTETLYSHIVDLLNARDRETVALRELLETRLSAIDRATTLFQENLTRVPTDVDKAVGHLRGLHDEKFVGVQRQFDERDKRAEQLSLAAKEAVATAFQASKEAVAAALQAQRDQVSAQNEAFSQANTKSETTTSKLLEQLGTQTQSSTNSLNEKIDDVRSRLTTIEGRGSGYSASWAIAATAIGVLLGIGGLVLALAR